MSYYTPPSSGGGGGIGGFPKVVAVANYTGQSGNLSFDLLSGALPTGDYLLADTLSIVTPDSSAAMTFTVGFNSMREWLHSLTPMLIQRLTLE